MSSVTHIVDDEKVLNEYEYDAWGKVVKSTETVKNRFKFNGQQLDPITQQYYLRARFYNPVIARFTQEDTYRGDGLNLYAYCRNNPVSYVDPTGHESQQKMGPFPSYEQLRAQGLPAHEALKKSRATGKDPLKTDLPFDTFMSPEDRVKYNNWNEQNQPKSPQVDTTINSGGSTPRKQSTPNSIYEQLNPDGTVRSRAFYDENGRWFNRQDFDHEHFVKSEQQYAKPHEHSIEYNEKGQKIGESDGLLLPGYDNTPTK